MKLITLVRYTLAVLVLGTVLLSTNVHAQQYSLRVVNLLEGPTAIDTYLENSPTFTNIMFGYVGTLATKLQGNPLNFKVTEAGAGVGSPLIDRSLTTAGTTEYMMLVYGTKASPKLQQLPRPLTMVPANGEVMVRVVHAASVNTAYDVYIDSLSGNPFLSVTHDTVSDFQTIPKNDNPVTLYITQAGKKGTLVAVTTTLSPNQSRITLVLTGASDAKLKMYAIHGEDPTEYPIPPLEAAGTLLPSVRAVNAWPSKNVGLLDIYLDGGLRTPKVKYRGTSSSYQGITKDSVTLDYVPVNEGIGNTVYSHGFRLKKDSGYTSILTAHSNGSLIPMLVRTYLQEPNVGVVKVRIANATDYYGNITIILTPEFGDTIRFDEVAFLSYTDWREIPSGTVHLAAYRTGESTPFYEGDAPASSNKLLTYIALGDDQKFAVDMLDESVGSEQNRMQTFDGPIVSVPQHAIAGEDATKLNNAPNPFSSSTHITFTLPHSSHVRLTLFDALGRRVGSLLDRTVEGGQQSLELSSEGLATGVYTCVLDVEGMRSVRKVVVQ